MMTKLLNEGFNNIIGPIPADDWILLKVLRENFRFYAEKSREIYKIAEKKEKAIYSEILSQYLTKRAA